jgi:hypothetical protein
MDALSSAGSTESAIEGGSGAPSRRGRWAWVSDATFAGEWR